MKVTKIDRDACKTIRAGMDPALTGAAEAMGLSATMGAMRYNPADGTVSVKVEFALPDAEQRAFASSCALFGMTPDQYGAVFTSQGRQFKVVGFNLRSPKYPIATVALDDGRTYKHTRDAIRTLVAQ